jgi:hypothetical protein
VRAHADELIIRGGRLESINADGDAVCSAGALEHRNSHSSEGLPRCRSGTGRSERVRHTGMAADRPSSRCSSDKHMSSPLLSSRARSLRVGFKERHAF